jgi:DNA-binding LytR/AlgR family response regulator
LRIFKRKYPIFEYVSPDLPLRWFPQAFTFVGMTVETAKKMDRIAWPVESGYLITDRTAIAYCQAKGSYTQIHFQNGANILISRKIKVVEQLLCGTPFFRVHESYICNLTCIFKLLRKDGAWEVHLSDRTLPVAKARHKALMECFRTIQEIKQPLHESKMPIDENDLFDNV